MEGERLVRLGPRERRVVVDYEFSIFEEVQLGALPVGGVLAEGGVEVIRLALEVAGLPRFGITPGVDDRDNWIEQVPLRLASRFEKRIAIGDAIAEVGGLLLGRGAAGVMPAKIGI